MKEHFLLDPDIIFLNHGSFGATPRPVLAACQDWQERLERQPVRFFVDELLAELKHARQVLGNYLDADPDDLVYVPNATYGVNIIARSLSLSAGDEILTTDHEYGACLNAWEFTLKKSAAVLVSQPVSLPLASPAEIADQFWQGVTPRTKLVFLSHISSPTAVRLPVKIICRKARQEGILTAIDGAHAPGQVPLDLRAIDPDFYTGNCHKWMLGPKGSGFLYTRRELQPMVEPLVVSWGWGQDSPFCSGTKYLDYFEWAGTNDPSAYLSVPAAIRFQEEHDWPEVQERCRRILAEGIEKLNNLTGQDPLYTPQAEPFAQMAVARLPAIRDLPGLQAGLLQRFRIEVPCIEWNGQGFIRISVQGYNTRDDLDALVAALGELLPEYAA